MEKNFNELNVEEMFTIEGGIMVSAFDRDGFFEAFGGDPIGAGSGNSLGSMANP